MLLFNTQLAKKVSGLKVAAGKVAVRKIEGMKDQLEKLKSATIEEVKSRYSLETVKDVRLFRCYRDFYWRLGIDPTKVRPASEALIRRILQGGSIPTTNTAVDAINIVSIQTEIVVDAFDLQKITGSAEIKFATRGERFLGIGMKHPLELQGTEIVVSDDDGPIALYPHRDAERTKVTQQTSRILTVSCGVPGIEDEELLSAERQVVKTVAEFCGGGETFDIHILPS
jgi:DNA/RNA-binding domain of Phe-tRNA-synthetase-like protein